jgi:hypothetical protein
MHFPATIYEAALAERHPYLILEIIREPPIITFIHAQFKTPP